MKKQIRKYLAAGIMMIFACAVADVTHVYDLSLNLRIPRVYDNMQSAGFRKYQMQTLKGEMLIEYTDGETLPRISVRNLVNKTHRINGQRISYICEPSPDYIQRLNYIGNNRKLVFSKPSASFSFIADPSYNIGNVEADNSLYLQLSGSGTSSGSTGKQIIKKLSGMATGTIGCGCFEYGHISPTRIAGPFGPTQIVDDVAAVYGKWKAVFKYQTR